MDNDGGTSFFPPWNRLFGSSEVGSDHEFPWERVKQDCLRPVILYYIPMLLSSYGLSVFVLTRCTDWSGLKLQRLAGQLSMYPAFLMLIYTSHGTMLDTAFWSNDNDRVGSSELCDIFANFYIATNIVQALGQLQTEKPPLIYQLMGHHILSVGCCVTAFYFNRFRWWTAFAGCSEFTNIFLVPVFACKEYFPEWRTQRWYLWSSRCLWISFITHRFVLFPSWLTLWSYDRWRAAKNNDESSSRIHWIEGVIYPTTILGLLILSIAWFKIIDRGLKKQFNTYLEAKKQK